ncbi:MULTISPECIES: hypothetical protein [Halobacterium]|nr:MULTISPECIES: hypothetical protein [Halobacterium]
MPRIPTRHHWTHLIGIPLLLGIWLYGIYDAYHLAEDPERAG